MDTSRLLLTIIKKTKTKQAFQVNDVNAFLHMARYKSLSSLKLFLWYASLILGPCILFSLSWIPSGYTIRFWWLHGWQHSLFTKVSDNTLCLQEQIFTIFPRWKCLLPWYFSGLLFLFFLIIFIFSIYCTMEILFSLSFSVLVFLEIYMSFCIIFFRTTQERNW